MELEKQFRCSRALCAATLIGAAILVVMCAGVALASGPVEKAIYTFQGGSDGQGPSEFSSLIAGKDGNLYGTTADGGGSSACKSGCGTAFELSPPTVEGGAWTETQLYIFQGGSNDGAGPSGALLFDKIGNLYGTTAGGGSGNNGTVFELSPPDSPSGVWTETVLYDFPADGSHGLSPLGNLVFDPDGNLYGTTHDGGSSTTCGYVGGCGTVFELSPPATLGEAWTETVIHEFGAANQGAFPWSGLTFDHTGALYGTTEFGASGENGQVYQIVRDRGVWTFNVIYTFESGIGSPLGGVILDNAGNVYGAAFGGLIDCGVPACGGVFELTPPSRAGDPWTENVLYSFTGGKDGAYPAASLLRDKAGNLYGTTTGGGLRNKATLNGNGTIFELSPPAVEGEAWTETTLHDFGPSGTGDGSGPAGGLVMVHGKFYGATGGGGSTGDGTVFSLTIAP
jgi:uncharacterized repeat protein (TIGR03803 family)